MNNDFLNIVNQETFNRISNLELIGTGGQKMVYSGTDSTFGEIVLKFIELHTESTIKRALRELEIAARLEGKEYPKLHKYDYIEVGEKSYLYVIEEKIEGSTLRCYLNKNEKVPVERAVDIGVSLLKGLIKVHNNKLVHRDIKPENIIINNDRLVLLDFGIARDLAADSLTADLAMFGPMTIGYAAPEQIKNQKKIICNRTDLFSWAIIIYELIRGYNPLIKDAKNREEVIQNTLNKDIPSLNSGNSILDIVIGKCLEKAVHRRPSSGEYLIEMLRGIE
ncbi:serine/threonine protein kinase [Bacillus spizizenii]|nr:serine/threonine protein kinase [Bacillus spizizenii]MCY8060445.1 serine/threonine protein kinase [Bacillus spizizenii]MCY8107309.1 serine/threonine protein kinase [Bacillus spizizenii]MCY8253678.1 serine/threonine protein kinase [Bacillus spizizenii]MCY8304914.1 serine/threonine protein kinase [Bacillus spizizenii]